jgi:hypothetical protein
MICRSRRDRERPARPNENDSTRPLRVQDRTRCLRNAKLDLPRENRSCRYSAPSRRRKIGVSITPNSRKLVFNRLLDNFRGDGAILGALVLYTFESGVSMPDHLRTLRQETCPPPNEKDLRVRSTDAIPQTRKAAGPEHGAGCRHPGISVLRGSVVKHLLPLRASRSDSGTAASEGRG